jgi:phage shock protein A
VDKSVFDSLEPERLRAELALQRNRQSLLENQVASRKLLEQDVASLEAELKDVLAAIAEIEKKLAAIK